MTSLPVPHVGGLPPFGILSIVALVVAILLLVCAGFLFHRHQSVQQENPPRQKVKRARHSTKPDDQWHKDVAHIRDQYHHGDMSQTQAYAALSALARDFASQRLGADFSSSTLFDLNQRHQLSSKEQFTRLRQTISALYPPEFAPQTNMSVQQATVDKAAQWVDDLFERWDK